MCFFYSVIFAFLHAMEIHLRFQHRERIKFAIQCDTFEGNFQSRRKKKAFRQSKFILPSVILLLWILLFPGRRQTYKQAVNEEENPIFAIKLRRRENIFLSSPLTKQISQGKMHSKFSLSDFLSVVLAQKRLINCFILFLFLIFRARSNSTPLAASVSDSHKNFFFSASLWDVNVIYNIFFSYQSFFLSMLGVWWLFVMM